MSKLWFALSESGVHVARRIASAAVANRHNTNYLRTKREKLGYFLTFA